MTLVRVACRRQDSLTLLYETLRERYRRRTGCSNGHFDLVPSLTL
ncbi:hypothetical protein [Nostoc sp.]